MSLLAIDIGTTHSKAGLFDGNGGVIKIASRPTPTRFASEGWAYYEPQEILKIISAVIEEVTRGRVDAISAIGIASMAETGLLIDRSTGNARSFLTPWFETAGQPFADQIRKRIDPQEFYLKFGSSVSYKSGLAKILWLCGEQSCSTENAVWLSAADFAAYWLTGEFGTDHSLAGRSHVFRVGEKYWDNDWLGEFGLTADLFPPAYQSGTPIGKVRESKAGLEKGIPVAVCGHDHICASLAVGVVKPGVVFDSMGTAESLIGVLPERPLTAADYQIGLHRGCHVVEGLDYWNGGLSASGGSVEWMRSLMISDSSYTDLSSLLEKTAPQPTEILYFPYLLGSGSPHVDPRARGAFIGLKHAHRREDLFKAVLEGTAYEMEHIRRAGEWMTGQSIHSLAAAGGGTRLDGWMQIKADISGCEIQVSGEPEATLVGAAMAVGIGCGVFHSADEALDAMGARYEKTYFPNAENHALYRELYEQGYLPFQDSLRTTRLWATEQH